jgi:hypothetical protein
MCSMEARCMPLNAQRPARLPSLPLAGRTMMRSQAARLATRCVQVRSMATTQVR